jgi:hypothetical protein
MNDRVIPLANAKNGQPLATILMKRDRSGFEGRCFFYGDAPYYYSIVIRCVIVPARFMRFPRVKADGQGFYHCVSRVVERRFIF